MKNQCACHCGDCEPEKNDKKVLNIVWQRLVSEGSTCPRCGSTEDELGKAVKKLEASLKLLGVRVELQKIELTLEEFKDNPVGSNSISMNGVLLEDLIGAETGQSRCCDVCGDEECRTVEAGGRSYETIPSEMIVRAGLVAASKIIN